MKSIVLQGNIFDVIKKNIVLLRNIYDLLIESIESNNPNANYKITIYASVLLSFTLHVITHTIHACLFTAITPTIKKKLQWHIFFSVLVVAMILDAVVVMVMVASNLQVVTRV